MYYHVTPRRNIRRILSQGLKPSPRPALGFWEEEVEDTRGGIHLGRTPEESLYNIWNTWVNNPEHIERIRGWALFELDLPLGWPLQEDVYGFLVTDKPIPPEYIHLVSSNITLRDIDKMDRMGHFDKLHEEIF